MDSSIVLDSCIGQELEGLRGSSRVVREQQSLVLFWCCTYRICGWLHQNLVLFVMVASLSSRVFYAIRLHCS
jgi:hypothetical protein